jgi:hypothetical protein
VIDVLLFTVLLNEVKVILPMPHVLSFFICILPIRSAVWATSIPEKDNIFDIEVGTMLAKLKNIKNAKTPIAVVQTAR